MSFFDQLGAKVNHGFNQVASQTKDFTEQVKIENEIKNLEKAVQANYEELGRAMYNFSRNPGTGAPNYEETMQQIDGILQQIQEKRDSKQEIMNKVVCPSCGKSVPAGTKFCCFCGAPIGQTTVTAPAEKTEADKEEAGRLLCPNCGSEIEPGAKFCVTCGAKLKQETEETVPQAEPENPAADNSAREASSVESGENSAAEASPVESGENSAAEASPVESGENSAGETAE